MQSAYIIVYLWKQAVEKAGNPSNVTAVRAAALGQILNAPEGMVRLENNHHLSKTVRIGRVRDDGLFEIIYATEQPVLPSPWNQFIPETKNYGCDWSNPQKGGKYQM